MRPVVSLQNLFELRKTKSLLGTREGVARVFEHLGRLGLCDASGALWPIVLEIAPLGVQHVAPIAGDVLRFWGRFFRPDGNLSTKYQDAGYVLRIEAVTDVVRSQGPWQGAGLEHPLPSPQECEQYLAAFKETTGSLFFRGASQMRARRLKQRATGIAHVRRFFTERGFLEVDAPVLVASGGVETYLQAFHTEYSDHSGRSCAFELPTSPEFALKKLLVEGHGKIFSLAKAFRNRGELSRWHEPEFLMLEWYRVGASLATLQSDTRTLVTWLAALVGDGAFEDLHWPVFTVSELFREHAGLNLEALQDEREFAQAASAKSISVRLGDAWNDTFCKVFLDLIEPELAKFPACFVTDYPVQQSVLAAPVKEKPFVKRFEAYLRGVEICNGFEELTDATRMDGLFATVAAQQTQVKRDETFEAAMRFGLPPCAGNALGVERVLAILLGHASQGVRPLLPFPFLARMPAGAIAAE